MILITYDITNNKKRIKMSNWLIAQGFERVQKSVFLGPADTILWPLKLIFESECNPKDTCCCLPFSNRTWQNHTWWGGSAPDTDIIQGVKKVLLI